MERSKPVKKARAGGRNLRGRGLEASAVPSPTGALFERLAEMEQRLSRVENALAELKPPPSAPEREDAPLDTQRGPRCPGCKLAVASVRRGRCPWCGFIFSAATNLEKPKKRAE